MVGLATKRADLQLVWTSVRPIDRPTAVDSPDAIAGFFALRLISLDEFSDIQHSRFPLVHVGSHHTLFQAELATRSADGTPWRSGRQNGCQIII